MTASSESQAMLSQLWPLVEAELKRRPGGERHTQRVVEYARHILAHQGGDEAVALAAAMLHDVGIPAALTKYSSDAPQYQQPEGEAISRRILTQLRCPREKVEAICDIVAHHHERRPDPSPEFRAVWDADALVNSDFSDPGRQAEVIAAFYTATGKELARNNFAARRHLAPPPGQGGPF